MNHSFSVEVAEKFGIEKAVILENFYFWIRKNKANKKNIHDGRCYTYNTAEAFAELFPYIKERKIAQLLREMENEDNLLISGQFFNYDRTKSYTLTDFALSFFEHSIIQNLDNGTSKKCIIENQDSVDCLNTDINTVINPNIKADELPAPSYIPKTEYKNCNEALKEIHKMILSHNANQTENKKKVSICKDFFYFSQNEARSFTELFKRAKPVEVIEALKNYLKVASADVYISSFSINAFCKNFNNYTAEYFDMSKYIDMPKGGLDEIAENTVNEMIEAGFIFRIPVFYKHKEEWFNMGMPKGEKLVQIVKEWTDKEDNQ